MAVNTTVKVLGVTSTVFAMISALANETSEIAFLAGILLGCW